MGKKYNHNPGETKKNEIKEPDLVYQTAFETNMRYSVEELRKRVDEANQEIRDGNCLTDDEIDDFVLS